ncbi:MAG: hypothetical protein AMJ56_14130 [Anaerolineae bacterium SG8_19]|nr:MAG: hypothetical protein AMJ56_14130 [Anaerolineae bacterium SG8_19]
MLFNWRQELGGNPLILTALFIYDKLIAQRPLFLLIDTNWLIQIHIQGGGKFQKSAPSFEK